ncbi:MAG: rRNA maturation RNase YbeY [Rhizobiaceae bacterium]|nr:rRNA maturation RNase YbeY [Rhizobiaceae bacterium]
MTPHVEIELERAAGAWPDEPALRALAEKAVAAFLAETRARGEASELSLLFTDDAAIRDLNAAWRGKDKPTNVLSFPSGMMRDDGRWPPLLGDIVLAWETVAREAADEGKPLDHHISHLIVHGLAHLVGHDHEDEGEAEEMEALERRVLQSLAIPDPYA